MISIISTTRFTSQIRPYSLYNFFFKGNNDCSPSWPLVEWRNLSLAQVIFGSFFISTIPTSLSFIELTVFNFKTDWKYQFIKEASSDFWQTKSVMEMIFWKMIQVNFVAGQWTHNQLKLLWSNLCWGYDRVFSYLVSRVHVWQLKHH